MKNTISGFAFLFFIFVSFLINVSSIAQTTKPELVVQIGHTGPVNSVCFSPNGKYALSGSNDNTLKLWDINPGKEIRTFKGHRGTVTSVCFSPDGKFALSGSWDNTLKLWNINTGNEIRTFTGHNEGITSVCFSYDGKYALSGSWDLTLKLWDVNTGREIRTFTDSQCVNSVCFSPDGKYILSGGCLKTLKLWDINTGSSIRTFKGHSGVIESVCFSSDGKWALSGSDDNTLKLWDINTGNEIRTFKGKSLIVNSVCFSPDGKYILSGSSSLYNDNYTLELWDINTGSEIHNFTGYNKSISSVCFSPDGRYVLSGSTWNNTLTLWDINTGKEIRTFDCNSSSIYSVSFSPDGKYALSGSGDETLKLWDITNGSEIRTSTWNSYNRFSSARFTSDGKYILSGSLNNAPTLLSGGLNHTLMLWDINTGKEIRTSMGYSYVISSVCFSNDGKYALSGGSDNIIILWDMNSGKEIRTFPGHNEHISSISFSPDENYAISGSFDNTLKFWDIFTGKEIRTFTGHIESVNSVCFSPDGKYVLSGSSDSTLKLWDINAGKEIRTFTGHTNDVNSVCFSPDGKYILSGSNDKTLKLWDVRSGKELRTFFGHSESINSVCFSPDGKYAISGSGDCKMKIWDIESGLEIVSFIAYGEKDYLTITPDNYYTCSHGGINSVAFVINNHAFPPEQFDLQYNRPDIVLERIGYADSSLIKAYREAYKKRLRKMNFKEEWFKPDFHLPELKIVDKDNLDGKEITQRNISFNIQAYDSLNNLDRINVFMNGVPVYGTGGINLRENKSNVFNENIEVELSDSTNKIEVSVLNSAGVESLKDFVEVAYIGKKEEPKTYFIGIGVSEYQNERWKLNYAAKDIRDLAGLYNNKAIIDTFIDEQATRENILKLKEKLLTTKVDDEIIIALSGHGILNDSNDFYYATWDMDFTNPGKKGLLFDDLDNLLDSIPARKKVLLIDACNSGELDKDKIQNAELRIKNEEITEKNDRKGDPIELENVQSKSTLGLMNSFELMQEIFVNLTRGNGAIVISAARGYQSALEDKSFGSGNGAFTACILEFIKSKNPGEHITVGELKNYVIKRVEEITNGKQKPTSRRENLSYDFVVW